MNGTGDRRSASVPSPVTNEHAPNARTKSLAKRSDSTCDWLVNCHLQFPARTLKEKWLSTSDAHAIRTPRHGSSHPLIPRTTTVAIRVCRLHHDDLPKVTRGGANAPLSDVVS
jgi:hypothetical protein